MTEERNKEASDTKERQFVMAQLDLLAAVKNHGSITAAAKAIGISYKTAWERVERLNNLSELPLVSRNAGGSNGGGTSLTEAGDTILAQLQSLQEQQQFVLNRNNQYGNTFTTTSTGLQQFLLNNSVSSSARNQFLGRITMIDQGAVNCQLKIAVSASIALSVSITDQSRASMALQVNDRVIALIKASAVGLALPSSAPLRGISSENIFCGRLSKLIPGAVNVDVSIDLSDGKSLSAIVSEESATRLSLQEGMDINAFFDANSVILLSHAAAGLQEQTI